MEIKSVQNANVQESNGDKKMSINNIVKRYRNKYKSNPLVSLGVDMPSALDIDSYKPDQTYNSSSQAVSKGEMLAALVDCNEANISFMEEFSRHAQSQSEDGQFLHFYMQNDLEKKFAQELRQLSETQRGELERVDGIILGERQVEKLNKDNHIVPDMTLEMYQVQQTVEELDSTHG